MKNRFIPLSLALALCMTVSVFSGCSGKSDGKQAQGTPSAATGTPSATKAPEEPYTIKFLSGIDPTKPYDPTKDPVKAAVEKALNIKINFEGIDVQQFKNTLNLRISAGDIPDIIKNIAYDDYKKYAAQGLFFDMTNLLTDAESPNIMKDVSKELLDLAKVKGKVYGLPRNTGPGAGYRWNLNMRSDYLAEINEKAPKTLDEYYNILKKIKAAKPDIIPMGAYAQNIGEQKYANNSFDSIFGAFSVTPGYFYQNNGTFGCYDIDPRMKEALSFLQKMYAEGLIDKEYSTMKETNIRDKIYAGKLFSWINWWSETPNYERELTIRIDKIPTDKNVTEDPFKFLYTMDSLVGKDGKAVAPAGGQFGELEVISAKTKDPKRLMKVIEASCTQELKMLSIWGIEKEDYVIENSKLKNLRDGKIDKKTNAFADGTFRGAETYAFSLNVFGYPKYFEALPARNAQSLQIAVKNPYQITDAANFLDSATKLSRFKELCTLRDTVFTQIIMGADIKKFDEFTAQWKSQGGDTILKELEASYKERSGK